MSWYNLSHSKDTTSLTLHQAGWPPPCYLLTPLYPLKKRENLLLPSRPPSRLHARKVDQYQPLQ
ncbi:hypothetical protein [Rubritalea tangerina]|uniref:hypothetical protein n=1 Tax=Rubritalea tangerina TaxID=430798 RepID=UPI00361F8679